MEQQLENENVGPPVSNQAGGATSAKTSPAHSNLVTGPIERTLLLFALPALGGNALQSLNALINTIWVGKLLGEQGLAATSNANLVMLMMFTMVFGFSMAATIIIGHYMGRRDVAGMRRAVGTGVGLFTTLGAAVGIFGWLLSPQILRVLGTPPGVFDEALKYIRIIFIGLPSGLVTAYLTMALRGAGNALIPMLLMIPGMILDVGLNPVFIRGLGPIPALGIEGSALATLVANLASFTITLTVIYRRDLPVRLRGAELRYLKPDRILASTILRKGAPMALQMIIMSLSALTMMGIVNREGTIVVAAYAAATQLWTYTQMPAFAISMAVSGMVAQNIGAGRWDRVGKIAQAGVITNLCLTGVLVVLTMLFGRYILALFLPVHGQSIAISQHINFLGAWSFILMGVTLVFSSVTRANGATIVPLIIMILAYIPGRIGSTLALRPILGTDAIWWSFGIGGSVSLTLSYAYYRFGSWRSLKLLATPQEAIMTAPPEPIILIEPALSTIVVEDPDAAPRTARPTSHAENA